MATQDFEQYIPAAAAAYGVDPNLLRAHLAQESGGNAGVTNPQSGAQGGMQFMPQTAAGLGVENPYDPQQAVLGAAKLISQNIKAANGDVPTAVAAYYGGADKSKWGPKTAAYQQAVMARYQQAGQSNADADFDQAAGVAANQSAPTSADADFDHVTGVVGQPPDVAANLTGKPTSASDPFSALLSKSSAATTRPGSGQYIFSGEGAHAREPVNAAQEATLSNMKLDQDAPPGSENYPYALTKDGAPPVEHGAAYLDQNGVLQHTPMTPAEQAALADMEAKVGPAHGSLAVTNGLLQGFAPEAAGLVRGAQSAFVNALGGGKPAPYGPAEAAWAANKVANERLSQYRMAHPISNALLTGGGSLASGALLTGAAGEGLNALKVPEMLGPSGAFLSGQAGQGAEGVGGSMLRAGSGMAQNALQGSAMGVEANHLTPNESPLQSAEGGAVGGAALGAAGTGARVAGRALGETFPALPNALRGLAHPFSQSAREGTADQVLREFASTGNTSNPDLTEYVENSSPSTAAAYGNSGLMMAEKALRATPQGSAVLGDLEVQNNAARAKAVEALRGDHDNLTQMIDERDAKTAPLLQSAKDNAQPADASPVVSKIDDVLSSGAGQHDEIAGPLGKIRAKLLNDDAGMTPETQAEYERGVMSSLGSDAPRPTQGALAEAKDRIGSVFDRVANGTNVKVDDDLLGRLGEIGANANKYLTDGEAKPILAHIADIGGAAENGVIPGDAYQALTKSGAPLDGTIGSNNSNVSVPAQQIREALDDALERSADPSDLADLRQARNQYRNLKIVQGAANKTAPGEMIDPSDLLASVRKATPNFAFKGGGDLGNTAQLGLGFQARPASLKTDPEQILGARDALNNIVSPLEGRLGASHPSVAPLAAVRDEMDNTLEQSMPGYKDYLAAHNEASGPINEKQFLLDRQLTALTGDHPTLAKVQSTINAVDAGRAKPGINNAKAVTPETYDTLNALKADLRRSDINPDKTAGSPTYQNLNANALLDKLKVPMAIGGFKLPGLPLIHAGANALYGGQGAKIEQILLNKLRNPEYAASAFAPPSAPTPNSPNPVYNGLAGGYVNQLLTGGGNRTPVPATR